MSEYNDGFIKDILNITKEKKFKIFFKDNITNPLSNIILNEIYPYVYLSIILVIISFILILSIFFLLIRHFQILNTFINKMNIMIFEKNNI
jgi:hypothetical protein